MQRFGRLFELLSDGISPATRFWFFAARENPDTAPLTIWLNGGVRTMVPHGILDWTLTQASLLGSPEVPL